MKKQIRNNLKKVFVSIIIATLFLSATPASAADKPKSTGINVTYRSANQIKSFVKKYDFNLDGKVR